MAFVLKEPVFCTLTVLQLLILFAGDALAVGGWQTADPADDRVREVARIAVEQYEEQTNSLFTSRLIRIEKAERQIVSGVNYRLTVDIGYTTCRRNDVREPSSCQTQQKQSCALQVWDQPWLDSIRLTKTDCGSMESVGQNFDTEEAATFAVKHLQSLANGAYQIQLRRVVEANKANLGGMTLKLKIETDVSSCLSSAQLLDNCKEGVRNEVVVCDVQVRKDLQGKGHQYVMQSYRCVSQSYESIDTKPQDKNIQVVDHLEAFESFKKRYGKKYDKLGEEAWRFSVFQKNLDRIKFLQDHELGTATYGVTPFADLTPEEFRKYYLSPSWDQSEDPRLTPAKIPNVKIPTDYDWRHFNAVTPVKNQGSCGSCWAFSVTGNIEGQWALQKKDLLSLSEQELVDCDKLDEGCNGGLPSNAYQEIQRLGGLETESQYPYKGTDDTCHLVSQDVRVYINGSLNISKNEDEMAAWLYKNGPMSIGINAFAMQFYFGGISHPWRIFCSPDDLDHGVLIVGYGVHKGLFGDTPYWIVKNSWGTWWGEQGYYLVYRGDGTCGLNQMVSSAIVK